MCTVFASEGNRLTLEEIKSHLERTKLRGPDDERIVMLPKGRFMAFQRLAIMGLNEEGMQPFGLNGNYSITNGELYGFRKTREELKKDGYAFASDSDCEIMLPLYEKYGTDMFLLLDAEFATVIYDSKKDSLIAARDPIGIRPLFYGYDEDGKIAFASEAKLLLGLCEKIIPFPPGSYYDGEKFVKYNDIGYVKKFISPDISAATEKINELLTEGVVKRLDSDAPLGFLLSGGLDSSLVCSIAAKTLKKKIRTFSIGMEKDAIDLKYAKEVATYLNTEHTEVIITRDDVINSLEEVISTLATFDITTIRASVGMYLICKKIHETTDIRVLLTGEVSDELFGYKYTDYAPNAEEFQKEAEKRMRELYAYDVLRADRCIADNSIEARVPFGDLKFAGYVMSLDPEMKMNKYGMGKYLLRKAFEKGNYLPKTILWREKAAFSDAVGHSLVNDIKEYAEELYEGDGWKDECLKYDEVSRPFTKESLLYRTIFEKYYPGQSQMIPTFWMPNRSWPGCNVDDPSARVLANYGNSGV